MKPAAQGLQISSEQNAPADSLTFRTAESERLHRHASSAESTRGNTSQPSLLLGAHADKMPTHRPVYLVSSIQGLLFSHPCQVHASRDMSATMGPEKSLLSFTDLLWPPCTLQNRHSAKNLASATQGEDLLKKVMIIKYATNGETCH